jgi:LPXTG-motif cell wall-anchored protein
MPTGFSPVAAGVAAAALAAGILMLLTEVTTVISIDVAVGSCNSIYDTSPELADDCAQTGLERSSVALLLLGLLTLVMGAGAAFGRSRPAAVALVAIGVVVLAITLLVDLPASDETGLIGRRYAAAEATAGTGLWLELAGGALALAAGLVRLLRPND